MAEEITAIAERPGVDELILRNYTEAQCLADYATARIIKCLDDAKAATDDLSIIAKLRKTIEERRKEYLSPFQEKVKAINETYKILMAPIEFADLITRNKILAFQIEQDRIRQEQEEINRKRIEAAEAEMKLKGELTESVNLVEITPEISKRVSTEMGTAGQRENWKWEVINFALLPDGYKVVDGALLTAVAKKHHDQKQIPGVRFYNEPIIAVRPR